MNPFKTADPDDSIPDGVIPDGSVKGIAGVIVAGGVASRMDYRDKPLLQLGNRTILQHIIDNARQQARPLLLNVNRNLPAYEKYGLPLVSDRAGCEAGPLAGILAAMQWISARKLPVSHLVCFPGDTPWFPVNTVALLKAGLEDSAARVAWLKTDGQLQPLFSLWSMTLADEIAAALDRQLYSPRYFIETVADILIDMNNLEPGMFVNINDAQTLKKAAELDVCSLNIVSET